VAISRKMKRTKGQKVSGIAKEKKKKGRDSEEVRKEKKKEPQLY